MLNLFMEIGTKWTWEKQPLNDRLLRPPTFFELYNNEIMLFGSYIIFIILFLILSYYVSRKTSLKDF